MKILKVENKSKEIVDNNKYIEEIKLEMYNLDKQIDEKDLEKNKVEISS